MSFPYHRMIRASAGSGKTYALTTRYLGLILCGESADSILAVTFTRTAAGEIMERILDRLLKALEPKGLSELTDALKLEGFTQLVSELEATSQEEAIRNRIEPALTQMLSVLHKCQVSTLDAFFSRIATGFTYECDLSPGWQILDEESLNKIRTGAIQKILEEEGTREARQLMHRLNKGKLSSQVAADLDRLVSDFHEKWREFPPHAWELPADCGGPKPADLERAWETVLRFECPKDKAGKKKRKHWENGLRTIQEVWGEDLLTRLAACEKGLLSKVIQGERIFDRVEIDDELFEAIQTFLQQLGSEYSALIRVQNQSTGEFLQKYDTERSRGLKEQGGLNYSDVPVALLQARVLGQMGLVDDRMDASVRHLLLDEFQDTSLIQFAVLDPLIDELAADSAGGRSIFCVGDSKQAIYGWRGGRAEVMDLFEQKLLPGSEERFDESWRSSAPILECVNQTFGDLGSAAPEIEDQAAVDKWSTLFDEHRVAAPRGPREAGHVTLRIANEHEGKSSKICPYLDTLAEVERLQRLSPDGTIAILVRKNQQISHLVNALKAKGIEASEERGNPLTDSPAVGRLIALLEWIEHPGDSTLGVAVERSPLPGILKKDPDSPWRTVLDELRERIYSEGLPEVFSPICDELAKVCTEEDHLRIQQFMEQLRSIGFHGLRLADLIEGLRNRSVPRPGGSPVQVMTIHQAKGLEFDSVILPELDFRWFQVIPGLLTLENDFQPVHLSRYVGKKHLSLVGEPYPQMYQQSRDQRLTEALCLLYVAMTRAKHTLIMLLPKPPKKGEYSADSYASLLVQKLAPGSELSAGNVLYEIGKPESHSSDEESSERARIPVGSRRPEPNSLKERASRASGRAGHLTAPRRKALQLGNLSHYLLEQCLWNDLSPTVAMESLKSRFPREESLHQEAVTLVCEAFTKGSFAEIFDENLTRQRLNCEGDDQIVVEMEIPILTRIGDRDFHGVIDRMVMRKIGNQVVSAELIDFKTDTLAKDSVELIEKYQEQMQKYRQAVHSGWGIPIDYIDLKIAHINSGTFTSLDLSSLP